MPRRPVKAEQIADALTLGIAEGTYPAQAWLPSLRQLGQVYDADPRTVTSALSVLAERGLIEQVRGRGARVVTRPVRRDALEITRQTGQWRGFHSAASNAGDEPYTDTYSIDDVDAPPDVAGRLGIPVGARLLQRARVQGVVVDGARCPVQLSTSWILATIADELPVLRQVDTGPGGMGSRMAELGYKLEYEDSVSARAATADECERLNVESGHPVLVAWRRAFDQTGQALEVTRRIINPVGHELVYRYR